jgi:hypothetical protein
MPFVHDNPDRAKPGDAQPSGERADVQGVEQGLHVSAGGKRNSRWAEMKARRCGVGSEFERCADVIVLPVCGIDPVIADAGVVAFVGWKTEPHNAGT